MFNRFLRRFLKKISTSLTTNKYFSRAFGVEYIMSVIISPENLNLAIFFPAFFSLDQLLENFVLVGKINLISLSNLFSRRSCFQDEKFETSDTMFDKFEKRLAKTKYNICTWGRGMGEGSYLYFFHQFPLALVQHAGRPSFFIFSRP